MKPVALRWFFCVLVAFPWMTHSLNKTGMLRAAGLLTESELVYNRHVETTAGSTCYR